MNLLEQKIRENKEFIMENLREHLPDSPVGLLVTSRGSIQMFGYHQIYEAGENLIPEAILMLYCCDPDLTAEQNYRDVLTRAQKIDRLAAVEYKKIAKLMKG